MKALLSKQAGGPETLVLEDIAEPLSLVERNDSGPPPTEDKVAA